MKVSCVQAEWFRNWFSVSPDTIDPSGRMETEQARSLQHLSIRTNMIRDGQRGRRT